MISSAISHHHEFHNVTGFKQHFKKRPFNVEETAEQIHNAYKKVKTTTSSGNFLSPKRIGSNYSSSFGLSRYRYIDLRDENKVETNSFSDIPRIIDLSTGEPLELIPSVEQLQKNRKQKRPIELVEDQDELSSICETIEENDDNLLNESSHCSHKRIRISREYTSNFIEEEEKIDTRVHERITDIVNDVPFNKANSVNFTESSQSSQSLSLYVHGKNSSNIRFTTPYQKAMTRYMRSQFQHLNNEEYENEGKQIILYHPRNKDNTDENSIEDCQNGVDSCFNDMHEDHMDID